MPRQPVSVPLAGTAAEGPKDLRIRGGKRPCNQDKQ